MQISAAKLIKFIHATSGFLMAKNVLAEAVKASSDSGKGSCWCSLPKNTISTVGLQPPFSALRVSVHPPPTLQLQFLATSMDYDATSGDKNTKNKQ